MPTWKIADRYFFKKRKQAELNEEIDILKRPITRSEKESVKNKTKQKKKKPSLQTTAQDQMAS